MRFPEDLETWIKILTMVGAVIAFFWGVFQYLEGQREQTETRRIEATRPFLERQLKLYTVATQVAAALATSTDERDISNAKIRFWALYWGELALVEDKRVEAAMVQFGRALEEKGAGKDLDSFSLDIAHACRDSLADSWGVKEWRNPHFAGTK